MPVCGVYQKLSTTPSVAIMYRINIAYVWAALCCKWGLLPAVQELGKCGTRRELRSGSADQGYWNVVIQCGLEIACSKKFWHQVTSGSLSWIDRTPMKQEIGEEKITTAYKEDVVLEKHVTSWGIASLRWEGEPMLVLISVSQVRELSFLNWLIALTKPSMLLHTPFAEKLESWPEIWELLGKHLGLTAWAFFCCGIRCFFQCCNNQGGKAQSLCWFTDLTCQVILGLVKSRFLKFWISMELSVSVVNLVTEGDFYL